MNLSGFVPLSLCDFPGRVAAVIFTQGCNFRCPFCHNGHLLPLQTETSQNLLPEVQVLSRINERKTRLRGVVVTGGEPTLQPDLIRFLRHLKTLGLAIKLDTNGSFPQVLQALFDEHLVDFVAMDIKAPWHKYALLSGNSNALALCAVQHSVNLIASSGVAHQFRTTRVDPFLNSSDYDAIQQQIPANSPHVWQTFRPEHSLDPALNQSTENTSNHYDLIKV